MSRPVQTTPGMAWLAQAMADKAAAGPAPLTPYGAWLALCRPVDDRLLDAEAHKESISGYGPDYDAARLAVAAARAARDAFLRTHRAPKSRAAWKDMSRDAPLLTAIFGAPK